VSLRRRLRVPARGAGQDDGTAPPRNAGRPVDPERPADAGQVTILAIGFMVVALALITVVVSATGVHLERKRLLALADLAALSASDALAEDRYFAPGAGGLDEPGIVLSDDEVRADVETYIADHPDLAARWDGVQVLEASTTDGRTVVVRLGAVTRPVLLSWVTAPWSDGIALEATSSARAGEGRGE